MLLYTVVHASAPAIQIALSGTVTDGNNPVENTIVSLVNNPLVTDTTDADGAFSISNSTGGIDVTRRNSRRDGTVRLSGNRLQIPIDMTIEKVSLYNAGGRCIRRYATENDRAGSETMDLSGLSSGVYPVTFSAGRVSFVRKLLVTATEMYLTGTDAVTSAGIRQRGWCQAAVDQLKITGAGFKDTLVDISSYRIDDLLIVLKPIDSTVTETSLCRKYANYFRVGAAIDGNSYRDAHAAIWKEHFNAAVCENEMKWESLQPTEGNFQFDQANAMVNAAVENGMLVRGHVLVWYNQTPDWVFQGSKEQVLQRIRTHVTRVMQEFKGRVYAWDVVNEAVIGYDAAGQDVGEDLGPLVRWGYRNSRWQQLAGEDHIFEAFRAARAADPDAKLFYNDYWNYLDGKREFIISFVKRLQAQNLIDGVGLQCHLNISTAQEKMSNQTVFQTVENLEKEIQEYAALGLDVHITELDISIYTRDYGSGDQSRWYTGYDLNEEYQDKLAARYREFFEMFRRNADKLQNVTFWGIADDNTWLSELSSGRPDHPMLFDKHLQPKNAFDAVMDF